MIGCSVKGYKRSCTTNNSGGADLLLVGDANDWNFTEGPDDANGDDTGYSTLARRTGGSGATATATASNGGVSAIAVGAGGTNYISPVVTITGAGTGATAFAVVTAGVITNIVVTNPGTGYTGTPTVAVTEASSATAAGGAFLYSIDSIDETIGVDITQANSDGTASSYEYAISARLAKMSQAMTNFNRKIDAAAACCQLVFVWRTSDGTIFVAGEKYVNNIIIPKFKIRQDGSKLSTGKKFTEFNGQDLNLKGTYSRPPFEFTGGFGVIQGFMPSI